MENIWQYLRATGCQVFETYEAIIDAACEAWNKHHRPARYDLIDRNPCLGACRSIPMTGSITLRSDRSAV